MCCACSSSFHTVLLQAHNNGENKNAKFYNMFIIMSDMLSLTYVKVSKCTADCPCGTCLIKNKYVR
uniref:Uncharacterized protein n=1 Tax=Arundo donax TaxID=35708 RepID=A0A0A9FXE0_ARUDO